MAHPYLDVADDLLGRIRRGEWKKGERIPAVRALEALYPHSRMTVHKALLHLQAGGYLSAARGRGTFVKSSHVRDSVAVLAGGMTLENGFSPLALACVEHARAHLARLGLDPHVYAENPLAASRMPEALIEDLDAGRIKGLLAITSGFSFRYLGSDAWRRQRVPYVDIGSQPAPHRVYIDFEAFFMRAAALAASDGRRRTLVIASGSALPAGDLRKRLESQGVQICAPASEPAWGLGGREEWGFRFMTEKIRKAFDCLIVPEDGVAKGVAQGALACGLAVPRDLRIVALANRGAELFYPVPVTQLQVDVEALVMLAVERLLRLLREPALPSETILIPPDREACSGESRPTPGETRFAQGVRS